MFPSSFNAFALACLALARIVTGQALHGLTAWLQQVGEL